MDKKDLEANKTDLLITASNAIFGAIPFGSILSEIVSVAIPNQRIDRLTKYCIELENKLSKISAETIEDLKNNEQFIDMVEESFVQASRALSDERRKYIASIVANGITDKTLELEESKYILKLLQELNDIEIIWLRYYSKIGKEDVDDKFRDKHENILSPIHAHMGSDDLTFNKVAIRDSYKVHLERLKLIESKIKIDKTTKMPVFDVNTGHPKTTFTRATRLGKILLSRIGLNKEVD